MPKKENKKIKENEKKVEETKEKKPNKERRKKTKEEKRAKRREGIIRTIALIICITMVFAAVAGSIYYVLFQM